MRGMRVMAAVRKVAEEATQVTIEVGKAVRDALLNIPTAYIARPVINDRASVS